MSSTHFLWLALVALITLIVTLSLWPLTSWRQPIFIFNGADRTNEGALRFASPGIARSVEAPPWLEWLSTTPEPSIALSLKVKSYANDQHGPARLFTISRNEALRNLTIAQDGPDLVLRLRSPESDANGRSKGHDTARVPDVFAVETWRDLSLTITRDRLKLECDGTTVIDRPLAASPFPTWDRYHYLALGNELTFDRPWRGEIASAILTVGGTTTDLVAPGNLKVPRAHWDFVSIPRVSPFDDLTLADGLVNFLVYVPLGLLVGWLGSARSRWGWIFLAAIPAFLSGLMELLQIAIPHRVPATSDVILNTLGGIAGLVIAYYLPFRSLLARTVFGGKASP